MLRTNARPGTFDYVERLRALTNLGNAIRLSINGVAAGLRVTG